MRQNWSISWIDVHLAQEAAHSRRGLMKPQGYPAEIRRMTKTDRQQIGLTQIPPLSFLIGVCQNAKIHCFRETSLKVFPFITGSAQYVVRVLKVFTQIFFVILLLLG